MNLTYLQWNDLLASYFFNEENAGKEVLLYVNESVINGVGEPYSLGVNEFVEAVRAGPPWTTRSGICQRALQAQKGWRQKNREYPPYIAYLSLFVLAAVKDGDYAPNAYYPRLRDLLGDSSESMLPSFHRMIDLWDDLEKWSREDCQEQLGRFVARIRGQKWMVGLPLSQTLISEDERRNLLQFLYVHEIDPLDLPTYEVVLRVLQKAGGSVLKRRTLQVLNGTDEICLVLRDALVDVVVDELEASDGSFDLQDQYVKQTMKSRTRPSVRLCLKYDELGKRAYCRVRIRSSASFPEDGCSFKRIQDGSIWKCTELIGGWSDTLYNSTENRELDGSTLNWLVGESFHDIENQWNAKLRSASIRVFTKGRRDGLPDYVERQRLERNEPFFIVSFSEKVNAIREWGNHYCDDFKEISSNGLPSGWTLFSGENAHHSCHGIDALTISPSIRLLLKGGVKVGRSNVYLKGSPPHIVVENAIGNETVTLNSQRLLKDDHFNFWHVPEDAEEGKPLRIEVTGHEQTLSRLIWLESPHLPVLEDYEGLQRNKDGAPSHSCDLFVQGSIVKYPLGMCPSTYPKVLTLDPSSHVVLIGAVPGQIAELSNDDLPSWQPVWAIVKSGRKQLTAIFCGTEKQAVEPFEVTCPVLDKSLVKRWKKFIWHDRKRVSNPELKTLRDRWNEYLETARNVR